MMINDRRGGADRRTTNRYPVDLAIEWETTGRRFTGSMSDVSFEGCFVLGSGDVADGDDVRLFVPIGEGIKAEFTGKIANHVYEIGFGVKFDDLSDPQREVIVDIVRQKEAG